MMRLGSILLDLLASVLFWDVMFTDNALPMGDGVGLVVDGHYVADWTTGILCFLSLQPQKLR